MIWLKEIMLLFLKKSSIVCFKFSLLDFSSSSTNNMFLNIIKTLCSAQWLVLDPKFHLTLSCEPKLSKADIMLSRLFALYSQFLAMMEYNINITEEIQRTFNDIVNKPPIIKSNTLCVFI